MIKNIQAILSGSDRRWRATAVRTAAAALTPPYRLAVAARNACFDLNIRRPRRLRAPVVSVGNITAGGTGKTPMVAAIVHMLCEMGAKPAVLMRGYAQDEHGCSDEQAVLAAELNVPVACNRNRAAGASAALTQQPDTDVFVLDDGFQHRQIHRDLDLVLVDATEPFGYGRLLPRGLLREPITNLRRADAIIVTHAEHCSQLQELDRHIANLAGAAPVAHASHAWAGYRCAPANEALNADALRDKSVMAVCGIGNPKAFEQTARQNCGELRAARVFPDHHHYSKDDLQRIFRDAAACGAEALITTEKDWVKWQALLDAEPGTGSLAVYRPVLRMRFLDGSDALQSLLKKAVRKQHCNST